jgi:hypothetical protein
MSPEQSKYRFSKINAYLKIASKTTNGWASSSSCILIYFNLEGKIWVESVEVIEPPIIEEEWSKIGWVEDLMNSPALATIYPQVEFTLASSKFLKVCCHGYCYVLG